VRSLEQAINQPPKYGQLLSNASCAIRVYPGIHQGESKNLAAW